MGLEGVGESYAEVNGVRLHYVEAGSGPLVVLLHGFPEFWYCWRAQIPLLAAAGFHVVAPDMRGYGLSDKPRGVRSYDAEQLAGDVAGLIAHLGAERAHIVGHDWGGTAAYLTAMEHPEVLERLVIIQSPHPARMLAALKTAAQLRKSWYMFFFQVPWLPEALMRRDDFSFLKRSLRAGSPGVFGDEALERYAEAWAQYGALTGMVNYYRAALRRRPSRTLARMSRIDCPVLVIWGDRDRYLGRDLAAPEPRWVSDVRVEHLPEASHWVPNDSAGRVGELLLEFLS
jgi:pimeloyl-ACP methyl ester carboxylesterase